jgi:hypothetical protein
LLRRLANWNWPLAGEPEDFALKDLLLGNITGRLAEFEDNLASEADMTYNYGMGETAMLDAIKANEVNSTLYTLVEWDGGRYHYQTCNLWQVRCEHCPSPPLWGTRLVLVFPGHRGAARRAPAPLHTSVRVAWELEGCACCGS